MPEHLSCFFKFPLTQMKLRINHTIIHLSVNNSSLTVCPYQYWLELKKKTNYNYNQRMVVFRHCLYWQWKGETEQHLWTIVKLPWKYQWMEIKLAWLHTMRSGYWILCISEYATTTVGWFFNIFNMIYCSFL